jgi:hypothetical protein
MAFVRCYAARDGLSHFEAWTCSHLTWKLNRADQAFVYSKRLSEAYSRTNQ